MRKIALATVSALTLLLVTAVPAMAASELPVPQGTEVRGEVIGDVVTPPGGIAFTGSDLFPWLLAISALVLVGVALLLASRRTVRAAR